MSNFDSWRSRSKNDDFRSALKDSGRLRTRTAIAGLLFLMGVSIPGVASADDFDAVRAQQDEKQASLNQRSVRAAEVADAHGRYILVRDTMYHGPNGVRTLSEEFYTSAAQWIQGWSSVLTILSRAPDLSRPDVRQALKDEVARQSAAWATLNAMGTSLRTRNAEALTAIAKVPRFPAGYVPQYDQPLAFLNSQIKNLADAISSTSVVYNDVTRAGMADILSQTQRAIELALRVALTSAPELQAAVTRVQNLFRAEREIEPRLKHVTDLYAQLTRLTTGGRYFAAQDTLTVFLADATRAENEIRSMNFAPEFSSGALTMIANLKSMAQGLVSSTFVGNSKADIISGLFTIEGSNLAGMCRDPELRKRVNCELFRTVFSIPIASLQTMTDAELRNIENQIARIEAGPLAEGSVTR